ncbi:HAD-IA family hydrolase [Burkholderia sp. BCCIQ04A]|uniref:HAD-IA family hydrolase n=1 Tax=Burkholderia anthinoferrum TaxID=3090833 RepID=A0ABU5WWW6_9BURK|nr:MULTISPECIES: HAD-IA family hydrolase [Burkholderia]MEB2507173.1 HAD-IA family hydrolase [Burkholderia anthinoferrum]MEB2532934.1 HAD-IA family hydrolase [Burkholderia anthinoferrum]MEB2565670.1 HAD-IA family hydrolase [Burkholderia anthinoferrum]MEB2583434.1 HAD-IA family hydrolase [Burkholderia anthinoferrum]KVH08676.1 HAD family hydrolase [Burkholderia anthina]
MRLAKVSALSFDLDDTLWPFGPSVVRAEAALRAWLIEHAPNTERVLPTQQALGALRDEYERLCPELAGDFRAMRIGSIRLALERANEDVSLTDRAYDVFYAARNRVEFYEDALPALAWLSERFPLIAVTNGNADLRLTGGGEFFRTTLSAREFGFAKPEPEIFHAAADALDVRPGELLHVGDDFHLDIVGALNAGLQAAWVVREPRGQGEQASRHAVTPHLTLRDLVTLCHALGGPDTVS